MAENSRKNEHFELGRIAMMAITTRSSIKVKDLEAPDRTERADTGFSDAARYSFAVKLCFTRLQAGAVGKQ